MTESLVIALDALRGNKLRSVLTMLGVTIGVAAVILLVSIVTGLRLDIARQIAGLGSDLLLVFPGQVEAQPGGAGRSVGIINRLTRKDADNIRRFSTRISNVVPLVQNNATLRFGNRSRLVPIVGTIPEYVPARNFPVAEGRFFTDAEVDGARKVIVIGNEIRRDFFSSTDPVGERMTLAGQKFTVVGVMVSKGGFFGVNLDDQVWIPITVAENLFGSDMVGLIFVEAKDPDDIFLAANEARQALLRRLDSHDFSVLAQEEVLGTFQSIMGIMALALGGIASISLLVGGIGIMNIMLVSVTERTREIGIRKAVGARRLHILGQFLTEAVALSTLGGVLGILLASGASVLLNQWLPSQISLWAAALAFGFSVAVGVFFGVYPALKASRLDPIDALRYE